MTISLEDAEAIALHNLPAGAWVAGKTEHKGLYLFLAPNPDPLEGHLDPFFSVDKETGYFRDFSPQDFDNPAEVLKGLYPDT